MGRQYPQAPPTRPLVLLVEDHEDTRAMYALSLSAMGFDVVSAEDRRGERLPSSVTPRPRRARWVRRILPKAVPPRDELATGLRRVLNGDSRAHVER
jgi:hypothetical protein